MIKRLFIILIVATVVLTAVYVVIVRSGTKNDNAGNQSNSASNRASDGGSNANSSLAATTGDIVINKATTYRSVSFDVESARLASEYRGVKAPEGTQFVVLYLKPFADAPSEDPLAWAGSDIRLAGAGGLNALAYEISLPSAAGQQGGYLVFEVPAEQKSFTLTFGSGKTAATIDISL